MISNRKLEHLKICMEENVEYNKSTGFNDVELIHNTLPEINKDDIDLSTDVFGKELDSPLFITAITGGHPDAKEINKNLAIVAEEKGIGLGIGSQRAGIQNPELVETYSVTRDYAPNALLLGNIGAPQIDLAEDAVKMFDADILAVHLNPLQESIQPEGDVDNTGFLDYIEEIINKIRIPVMAKETGCGISAEDAKLLESVGVSYIDVEGAGGTSWAAVETYRADDKYLGKLFWDWGIPTSISTVEVINNVNVPVISSGGIRTGLDAAKAIALGADSVGMALPALKSVYNGMEQLEQLIERFNESLKIAMFLVGAENIEDLKNNTNLIIKGETREWLEQRGINTKKYSQRRKTL